MVEPSALRSQAEYWFTEIPWPAAVIVPVRELPVLTPTVKVTVPLPVPVLPPLTKIQGTFADAFQPQSGALEVTLRLAPVRPEAATETLRGDTPREQTTPA